MEGLLNTFLNLISPWDNLFPRKKSARRAKGLCISLLMVIGRKLFTRALAASGRDQLDWSAYYKLFSRCRWSPCNLFRPILREAAKLVEDDLIAVAFDDTLVKKTGKKIKGTSWQRDSLSPHFHVNFVWGMRYLQASILLPLYNRRQSKPCRAIPVQFTQLPKVKKPKKKASPEEWEAYEAMKKRHNTSTEFVKQFRYLRNELNREGFKDKKLLAVVDSTYVNRTCFQANILNADIIGRTRKNARLFFRASKKDSRRFYDPQSYTAEELRKDDKVPYTVSTAHYAGEYREVRYKEFNEVFWKWGTKRKPLRLIIVAPTPYRKTHYSRLNYRDPAYLLTTNLDLPAQLLIQKYLDRWQIEVNFKEEKSQMSMGKQQVWSQRSIPRAPAFVVATYSALMLAGVLHFKDHRSIEIFGIPPKWRRKDSLRPSCADYMTVLRREILEKGEFAMDGPEVQFETSAVISTAAA